MSYWYNSEDQSRPTSVAQGEPLHWSDGLYHVSSDFSQAISDAGASVDWFWIVDAPARVISGFAMLAYMVLAFSAALYVAVKSGEWITSRTHKAIGITGGILVWLYVSAVLYRAQHWFAFELLTEDL